MIDIPVLTNEIDTDPLGRGYSTMSDAEVVVDMYIEYRTRNRTSMSGSELWDATDPTEYDALSDAGKGQWLSLCGIESHDPFGVSTQIVVSLFGGGSTTVTALQTARIENISRVVDLELTGVLREGHVAMARS